jgi:hypothetical protein
MATNNNGLVFGDIAALYIQGVRIAHCTGLTVSFNNEMREVVSNSSVRTYIYGRDSWNVSADGLVTFANGYNFDFLMAMLDNYQSVTFVMPTNASGTEFLEGIVLLESCQLKSDAGGDVIRMSLSFKGNGPLNRKILNYSVEGTNPKFDANDAGCTKQHPQTFYLSNTNGSYPYLQVGDTIYLDADHTTALTGYNNFFVGLKYQVGTAYQIDSSGVVTSILATTCTDLTN